MSAFWLEVIALATFIGPAIVIWALSRRYPLPGYSSQEVQPFDKVYLFVAFGIVATYDGLVGPLVKSLIEGTGPYLSAVQRFSLSQDIVIRVLAFLLVSDLLAYLAHRLLHTRRWWPFHAMHHSPRKLNWFSGMRGSPVHYVLILVPTTLALALFLHDQGYEFFVWLGIAGGVSQNLIHSNLRLPFARQIEWLFVTPRMHFVHHHPNVRFTDSNYGFLFSIWDHLFGTYVDADRIPAAEKGQLGLEYDESPLSMFLGLNRREPLREPRITPPGS